VGNFEINIEGAVLLSVKSLFNQAQISRREFGVI
jgi:hypothetical protein